ncbi:MAG: ABC transporter permease [Gemmatimonadetes bacterium]|nr:ABC transporter permease [Gemmatimonadota bacterium]
MLSLAGGLAGLGLAWAGVRLLVARAPTTIPRLSEVSVDPAVLGFTLLVSVAAGLLFGLLPMRTILTAPLATTAPRGLARAEQRGDATAAPRALVASEMALAVLLLIGAGLTVRSFLQLMAIDPGFDGSRALTLRIALPSATYADAARVAGFFEEVRTEVRRLPGAETAGFVRVLPLADDIGDSGLRIDGRPVPAGTPGRSADWQAVTPGWFEAMRIRLVQGRFIDSTDVGDGAPVIVINETLAREYFPGEDPLGQRIGVGRQDGPLRTIVGVVGDVRHHGLTAPVKRTFYVPHAQWATSFGNPRRAMTLVVRTRGDPRALLEPVAALVRQRDPDLSLSAVTTLDEVLATATREQRFTMALMSGFALLALVLAAVGVYGVIAYTVAQRSREIGIRLALGAGPARVERLLVRQGMGPVVAGLGVGLGVALGVSRFLESLLYGVGVVDPVTFVVVPVVLAAVAVVAVVVPARRAVSGDPVGVLKGD